MNWDQIEHRWTAMTRRVRADWAIERPAALPTLPRRLDPPEGWAREYLAMIADRRAGFDGTVQPKTPTE